MRVVLGGNIFSFNGRLYTQRIGTAMGTRVAPTYACIFMAWLETEMLAKWTGTKPILFKRFIDDILMLWTGSIEELRDFLEFINKQHKFIKFTSEFDQETRSVPFLDMQVSINAEGKIVTDLYKKKTARVQYLLPSSCHPCHVTENIPYSLAYRLLRLCSNRDTFTMRLQELRQDLISRDYHPRVISSAFERVCQLDRAEALKKVDRNQEKSKRETLVITFHPGLPSISKTIRKHYKVMVGQSNHLKRCFQNPSLVAYRRPKNLGDMLIRAKVDNKTSSRKKNGFTHCGRACMACIQSEKATEHRCNRTGQSWKINAPINCQTRNVIYKLGCRKCPNFVYVGETQRRFCDRLTDHRGYINRKVLNHPIGLHFNQRGHDKNGADLLPIPIERVLPMEDHSLRRRREKVWIQKYDAIMYGANSKE